MKLRSNQSMFLKGRPVTMKCTGWLMYRIHAVRFGVRPWKARLRGWMRLSLLPGGKLIFLIYVVRIWPNESTTCLIRLCVIESSFWNLNWWFNINYPSLNYTKIGGLTKSFPIPSIAYLTFIYYDVIGNPAHVEKTKMSINHSLT